MTGIAEVFTNTLPSLAVEPVTVCLLPSKRTSVEDSPRPLRLTFVLPCNAPEVKESALFSDPESITILAVISAASTAPIPSIVSLSYSSTGEAPSVGLPLIYEPVTTTSSTSLPNERLEKSRKEISGT